jgi:hypothetical protein
MRPSRLLRYADLKELRRRLEAPLDLSESRLTSLAKVAGLRYWLEREFPRKRRRDRGRQ